MTRSDLSLKAASSAQNNDKEQVSQCSKGANGSVSAQQSSRLLSLDLLRGMDLALLVLFHPVVYEWVEASRPMPGSFGEALFGQITHVLGRAFAFGTSSCPCLCSCRASPFPSPWASISVANVPTEAISYCVCSGALWCYGCWEWWLKATFWP